MRFIFEGAAEALNTATRIAEHITGKMGSSDTKTYKTITVALGLLIEPQKTGEGSFKPAQSIDSRVLNDLVTEYFKARLPEALDYALAELGKRYDHALLGSKTQLQDYLAQIEALEHAPATDSPVAADPVHVPVDQ